jgi:superfamily II DNA or RNA helicase
VRVIIDTYAWIDKSEFTLPQLQALRAELTIYPRKSPDYPADDENPIYLYHEDDARIGIARDYFLQKSKTQHNIKFNTTQGDKSLWAGPIHFSGNLRPEQEEAISFLVRQFNGGVYGGILQAPCGWGKTVATCSLISRLQAPTAVIVHKEFLMNQWRQRIEQFLPGARIGICQQDKCEYEGKHVVLCMVHSLAAKKYPVMFYRWPGLVINDEVHRVAAATWAPTPGLFPAQWRLGISATPRRKDGADGVFFYHLGKKLFIAKQKRLTFKVRVVRTKFKLVKTARFNPNLAPKSLILNFLCKSDFRNRDIVTQINLAVEAGRKLLVLSERLEHLATLEKLVREMWPAEKGNKPTMGYYVGGRSEKQLEESSHCQIIFATSQYAAEALDIPELDTLFLTTPLSDIEQAVGRILRPFEGKKDPVVVDFRDDMVPSFQRMAETRQKHYTRLQS